MPCLQLRGQGVSYVLEGFLTFRTSGSGIRSFRIDDGPPPSAQIMNAMGMINPQSGLLGSQPIPSSLVNPATNDAPLEFNMNKNKAPMAISGESDERGRNVRERRGGGGGPSQCHSSSPGNPSNMPAINNQGQQQQQQQQQQGPPNVWATGGMMGMGYPTAMMGMMPMADPRMMPPDGMMQGHAIGPGPGRMPLVKEIIHCKSCTLFPPNPNCPAPTTRERPPGCRTVFVGGLPENITDEIIREVFERCGEITTIRVSKKNFCHIRFEHEEYVDSAIFLSGYRIRLGSHTDPPNTGRLHVDYAQARDDLYEWECRQRQLQREQRHRERLEQERMRPPSPPPVVHYTEHEAQIISDKIKVQVVIVWLERGDCSKRNANQFYSMIQSTNSHVRRLMSEKMQYEDELARAKEMIKQLGQIERVFSAASHQKVWDHFTKAQRKNISMWKKQASEIRNMQLEEAINERADEEMDVSDSDNESDISMRKKPRYEEERANPNNIYSLKEENDSLRCQLEAYKNEVDLIRADTKSDSEQREAQFKLLQQTLHNAQQQLLDTSRKLMERESTIKDLEMKLSALSTSDGIISIEKSKEIISRTINNKDATDGSNSDDIIEITKNELKSDTSSTTVSLSSTSPSPVHHAATTCTSNSFQTNANAISEKDAKFIGLISTFLHVHPFGAGLDYVWSYLQKVEPSLRPSEVEALMSRFPSVFRHELSGIGANMERKWVFVGFDTKVNSGPN
ncbi:hypothetical protein B566_EDAN003766 [Ephemera danica]|nr:hypothetical protein B566_EDAN003766 [Ephemera danica]